MHKDMIVYIEQASLFNNIILTHQKQLHSVHLMNPSNITKWLIPSVNVLESSVLIDTNLSLL